MKKKLLLPLLPLLCLPVLTTAALAAVHADGDGTVWESDADGYYALEAPAPLAAALAEDLTPLGDPSNLRWSTETTPPSGEGGYWPETINGEVHWEIEGAFQQKVEVKFYRVGQPDKPVRWMTHHYSAGHRPSVFSEDCFYYEVDGLPSGDYYFTVQNLGDGVTYGDSAVVSSLNLPDGVYHYVEPSADTTLETPKTGHWEWPAAIWEDHQEEDPRILTYEILFGYSAQPAQAPEDISFIISRSSAWSGELSSSLQDRLIGEHGAGWYYFQVRPISADIERWRNGGWSEWSEGYNLAEASLKITETLNAIDKTARPKDIRAQVQALNKTELHNALTADIQGAETGTADALAALETALGGPAKPAVAPELQDKFDASQVSIVGAALNNVTGDPALNIGAPKDPHDVRDENYSSTLAVDFSMDLSGVENSHDLAVPVKVTLPIPEGINPDYLAILHYRASGRFEEVLHTVFEKDGQWYASFVLTSFSDFTLTVKAASIEVQRGGRYQAVNPPAGAALVLARYEGGRLTAFQALPALSGTLEGSGKLFLLDEGFRPQPDRAPKS